MLTPEGAPSPPPAAAAEVAANPPATRREEKRRDETRRGGRGEVGCWIWRFYRGLDGKRRSEACAPMVPPHQEKKRMDGVTPRIMIAFFLPNFFEATLTMVFEIDLT